MPLPFEWSLPMIGIVVDEIRSLDKITTKESGGALGYLVRAALVHNRLVRLYYEQAPRKM